MNAFAKGMQQLSHRHNLWDVWRDFLLMSASSVVNAVDRREDVWQAREDDYLRVASQYSKDELSEFARLFALLVDALHEPHDFLGKVFMELELSNKWRGQFFTPDALCQAMAAMLQVDEMVETVNKRGFVTVSEPSVGGGATVIGLVNALRDKKVNYQQCLHVTAVDVDIRSVHMAYLQLSLLHVPAIIVHGNTLTMEEWSHWYTPAHIMGGWNRKLRQPANDESIIESATGQMEMFELPAVEEA